ncbi:MAG: tetratricopeptide repeat protein, partial [Gammaproteobacteria bacterium]|nr:tetratricopeptide repeat protein [Gammaproteobacteria bacterium]NIW40734.1 tetratricopeptide repeat protein [candidate division Zixibacteria bacterium]NIX56412.1 tetratricopeptide repeat protein [candidate division Zixibacteria bacterium]
RNNDRPEDALEVLSRVQNNYHTETELQEQFGITYYMNEQYQEAKDFFTEVHSRNPDLMRPKHFLAFIYDQLGNRDSAEVMYQKLLEEIPDEPLYLNNLAYIYAVQGKNL